MLPEIDWLEHQIEQLRERCDQLEKENFELKRCIGRAITNLERDNQQTREYIEKEETKIVAFTPNFKKPKWESKD
jgi:predicted RNase H-like nuclease (RuvC/YqgF family)